MSAEQRQQAILEALGQEGELAVTELSARFAVSEMTVRRDVTQLAAAGLVTRTHGSVALSASGSFEPPFALRAGTSAEAKRSIAVRVAERVLDGQTLILDGGTTGLAVAEQLVGRNITVCALNLRVADLLAAHQATRVMVPGGRVRAGEFSISGDEVHATLGRYRFDLYVLTASGISATTGLTEWNAEDAAVKRAALASASHTLAACDATKVGRDAFARICGVDDIDTLLTDDSISEADRRDLALAGADVQIA